MKTTDGAGGPLDGVRVVDLTTILMGPYATQLLADMGADVIKVEPLAGDPIRYAGPSRSHGMGPIFLHVNRNKRSIALDLKSADGIEAMMQLCDGADVVAFNVRAQAMDRLGLGYDALRARNPRLIYAGMSGFGKGGPYAADPAYDDLIQGLAAFPATYARSTGNAPAYVPANICDRTVGLYAVGVITAALFHRERTGRGQSIDIPMFETMAQFMLSDNLYGETFVPSLGTTGYARLMSQPRRPFATSDGHLCVLPYSDRHWHTFFAMAREAGVDHDPSRFIDMTSRTARIDELYGLVADVLMTATTATWLARLRAADIPAAPMHTIESLIEDEHLRATGFFIEDEHPTEGRVRTLSIPSRWSDSQPTIRRFAPRLGQHSSEILGEAGYTAEQIETLRSTGIIGSAGHAGAMPSTKRATSAR